MVSIGTAALLTLAELEGLFHPHHPAFLPLMLVVVAFYVATPVVLFIVFKGLYQLARYPSLRARDSALPFTLWLAFVAVVLTVAVLLGGVR